MHAEAEHESVEPSLRDERVPDFFIVGQPKSGTTALYEMLRSHPQIFMPDFKEPRYYASDLPSRYQAPRASGLPPETYEDYLALFEAARPGQLVGEASTAYIWSRAAAARIAEARPEAKIIALLREPASYMVSLHLQLLQIRVETAKTLRKALALEPERRAGRQVPREIASWPQVLIYTDRVRYVEQLRRYREVFRPEQVLVLIYDDFRADNEGTVRRVLRFLEVDEDAPVAASRANPSVRMRSVRTDAMVRSVAVGGNPLAVGARRLLKSALPADARERLRRALWLRLVFGSPRPPDEQLLNELRRRFLPEVQALSEYLGRDMVKLWGYDQLG
ncbi:MAG: sulfotransferase family protein [Solirubrobacteraceae bacterium]